MNWHNPSSNHQTEAPQQQSPQRADEPWQFVVFNDPQSTRSKQSRRQVRSQAMRHYHRRARDPQAQRIRPLRHNELELDVTPLLERATCGVEHPITITMANRENELCSHLLDRTCVMFRTMQDIGFLDRVRQTAAFGQLLAMSSWHLIKHLHQHRSANEHLQLSLSATQQLQMQINDPLTCISDDAICAVLAFACCANLVHDAAALNAHMRGLQLIVDLRGGVDALNLNPVLGIMLHWVDVNGAYFQDKPPHFPPPLHLLPDPKPELFFLEANASPTDQISHICEALRNVQSLLHAELRHRNVWQDATFQGFYILPILGHVLALRSGSQRTDNETQTELAPTNVELELELFRLSTILYISALRTPFGVDTLAAEPLYAAKIQRIMASIPSPSFHNFQPVLPAWVLSVAVTSNCDTEAKQYFEKRLVDLLASLCISRFEDLRDIIKGLVWYEGILATQSETLRTLVTRE